MNLFPNIKVVTGGGLLSLATGIAVMIGWEFDLPLLVTVLPGFASMKFNAAICFVLLGVGLLLIQNRSTSLQKWIFVLLQLLIILISTLSIVPDFFHGANGTNQLFIAGNSPIIPHYLYTGDMGANTALCFILLAMALLGFVSKRRHLLIVSQYLLHVVTVVAALSILGYLYGLSLLYNSYFASPMALHTAASLFLLSLAASFLHPRLGITALFTGNLVGNKMARRVCLFIACAILIFGVVRIGTLRQELLPKQTEISLLFICFMGLGLALIWHTANWLNKFDTRRYEAEVNVKIMNEVLEKRVEERSGKLLGLLEKLRESEQKFRAAFEHSAIGMALVSLKGRWLKVNKRLCDIVGYREQELLSMSFHDLTHPDDDTARFDMSADHFKDTPYRVEKRYLCKNGSTVWVSINIAAVANKKGGPVYFVSQFEDITERKKAEQRLKKAYKEIKDHVNNINEIAWKQSHLVRSPLANLKGLIRLLRDDPAEKLTLRYTEIELERLDAIIMEMAEDACHNGAIEVVMKKRCLTPPAGALLARSKNV